MSKKVLVALSGGVDSAVAAFILKEQGYDVAGITMSFGHRYSDRAVVDARAVARQLDISHKVFNASTELKKYVIADFLAEYANGRTPNPCVRCNELLKFNLLFEKARKLGFSSLATGHFARIEKGSNGYSLKKGADSKKDQSYFLCLLSKKSLSHILFPLGSMTKEQVLALARKNSFCVADKRSSQEVCFIPGNDYRAFLKKHLGRAYFKKGEIVDQQGCVLGYHKGIVNYTIGQREGLGISASEALYCVKLDARENKVVVGFKKDVYSRGLVAESLNILEKGLFSDSVLLKAKIRYSHPEGSCCICKLDKDKVAVHFLEPQNAITPGQFVVFYHGDVVAAGAKITEVL